MPDRARLGDMLVMQRSTTLMSDVPISEHFTQTSFLVRSNDSGWFQINIKIRVNGVVPEVVFLEHGVFELVAPFFDVLDKASLTKGASLNTASDSHRFLHHQSQMRERFRHPRQSRLYCDEIIALKVRMRHTCIYPYHGREEICVCSRRSCRSAARLIGIFLLVRLFSSRDD